MKIKQTERVEGEEMKKLFIFLVIIILAFLLSVAYTRGFLYPLNYVVSSIVYLNYNLNTSCNSDLDCGLYYAPDEIYCEVCGRTLINYSSEKTIAINGQPKICIVIFPPPPEIACVAGYGIFGYDDWEGKCIDSRCVKVSKSSPIL